VLRELAPDLIITAAFGRILRPSILEIPRLGCLNVHASLLPRQRGAAPIPRAILDGDTWTGITIFRLDEGMDTGPILLQRVEPIRPDDTTASLTARLGELGAAALLDACGRIRQGTARFVPQKEDLATYAPMLAKEDGVTTFARPADHLERIARAFDPWPGVFVPVRGENLRLVRVDLLDLLNRPEVPGTVIGFDPLPVIATLPGAVRLRRVQASGKKEMDGSAWARGVRIAVGDRIA
jgi:methionyl-tRNA formyltransferase